MKYPDPETPASSHPTMDSSQSGSRKRAKTGSKSGTSFSTRRTSAYDPAFEQHLHDHGIYKNNRAQKPSNLAEINERLAQPRPSLSSSQFTEAAFEAFRQTNEDALSENTVMSKAFPLITGTANIPSQENLRFTNLKDLTDGSITQAQPDFYDGVRPGELNKQIREELGPYITPSTNKAAPCLPNFFVEGKGPKGLTDVCKNQAVYDGALDARGIHELRSYVGQGTLFDNNAYTITSTYHPSGLLTMYTTHPTASESPTNPIQYRVTQLRSFAMTDAPDTFRQGASAFRNARDWAEEKRKELIAAANGKVPDTEHLDLVPSAQSLVSLSSNVVTHLESETSSDELPLKIDIRASLMQGTPGRARPNRLAKALSQRRSKMSAFGIIKKSHKSSRIAQVM